MGDIPPKYGQTYGTLTYLHFRILEFPLIPGYVGGITRVHPLTTGDVIELTY